MSLSALPQSIVRESAWPHRLLVMGLALAVVTALAVSAAGCASGGDRAGAEKLWREMLAIVTTNPAAKSAKKPAASDDDLHVV